MPIHRKRFRIEEAFTGDMAMPAVDGGIGPMHQEIMTELRAIRAQMGSPGHLAATARIVASASREVADAQPLLETYSGQFGRCEKLEAEADLVHHAVQTAKL